MHAGAVLERLGRGEKRKLDVDSQGSIEGCGWSESHAAGQFLGGCTG